MPLASFRTILLLTAVLIAAALGAAATSGWMMLQDFARASRDASASALRLSAAVQQLDERSFDMSRSARQYGVLRDEALRERFAEAHRQALTALAVVASVPGSASAVAEWRDTSERLSRLLDLPVQAGFDEQALPDFGLANDRLAAGVRSHIERRNGDLLDRLDARRETLATQVVTAIAVGMALALAAAWWVLRPLTAVERAIVRLGEGRYDTPVAVGGPDDLRRLGDKLEWLRQRLADLETHRNRVLRHVSHELKTPLASLREGIALLRDGVTGELGPEQIEVSGILDANARALQERIEQLIGYNATQFDARHLELKPTALRTLAREVASDLKLQAQAKDVRLDVSGYAPPVRGDAAKLRIALTNLVANGIAFSPHGGTVRLELSDAGPLARIDCIDEGPGVAPDETERIFEPFFRGSRRAPRPDKGNGLGLAIVREFVAAHGGRAWVLPAERGAHFRIELPHVQ